MKKFFNTKVTDLTVAQSILYVLVVGILSFVATIAALMMPQACESIFDWVEEKCDLVKEKFTKKPEKNVIVEYEKI